MKALEVTKKKKKLSGDLEVVHLANFKINHRSHFSTIWKGFMVQTREFWKSMHWKQMHPK